VATQGAPTQDLRIRRRAEFEQVYANGRKLYGRYMILFCVPRSEPPARFGLAVSRRVGGAVTRNRVKRRMREICRRELPIVGPADYVLTLRREAVDAPFEELRAEVARLATRARKAR
jgi:ribonuclease P protein component